MQVEPPSSFDRLRNPPAGIPTGAAWSPAFRTHFGYFEEMATPAAERAISVPLAIPVAGITPLFTVASCGWSEPAGNPLDVPSGLVAIFCPKVPAIYRFMDNRYATQA
jgi:hypothetical protein